MHEFKGLNDINDFSKNGEAAKMSNGWSIYCNYDIKQILKKNPPKKTLSDCHPFDLRKTLTTYTKPDHHKSEPTLTGDPTPNKPKGFKLGKPVRLQDLTKDARKARVILRQLVRQKKIVKPGRWEWEEGSKDLEVVKQALNKT